jgi:LacI family transcriptional regulator
VVFIANEEFKRPVTSVHYDSFDAGYQAGEYLLGKGVRELLYVAGGEYNWIRQRELGIAAALRAAGLPEDALRTATSLLGHDDGRYEEAGYLAASAAFARRVPQAVVACNDRTAMGVARAASEFGLEVGRAIGLVGFDDEPESSALGLTTFQPPLEEMGAEAARLAINAVARTGTSQRICLHSHLIERHSTARVGAAVKEAIAAVV